MTKTVDGLWTESNANQWPADAAIIAGDVNQSMSVIGTDGDKLRQTERLTDSDLQTRPPSQAMWTSRCLWLGLMDTNSLIRPARRTLRNIATRRLAFSVTPRMLPTDRQTDTSRHTDKQTYGQTDKWWDDGRTPLPALSIAVNTLGTSQVVWVTIFPQKKKSNLSTDHLTDSNKTKHKNNTENHTGND